MRPIILATDYGVSDSYVGQLKSAIHKIVPQAQMIDLIHNLPAFNPKASAYLLASYVENIPANSIMVGVVDPGVGSDREAIIIEGDDYTFIGPNNGLLAIPARKLTAIRLSKIVLSEQPACKTFHGRDVFAPVAAQFLSASVPEPDLIRMESIQRDQLIGMDWPVNLYAIIYIDHFGNAVTGVTFDLIDATGVIRVKGHEVRHFDSFHCARPGELFWYSNANGLISIAAREASAAELCQLSIGEQVYFE